MTLVDDHAEMSRTISLTRSVKGTNSYATFNATISISLFIPAAMFVPAAIIVAGASYLMHGGRRGENEVHVNDILLIPFDVHLLQSTVLNGLNKRE